MTRRLYFVAGEPSGDLIGREVMDAIRARTPNLLYRSTGGTFMAECAPSSGLDTRPLAVLGFWEGIKAYRDVVRLADKTANDILTFQPDAVVLIDSWGFTLRVAQRVRARATNIRLIKLIGPQVWATRPGRAKTLAETIDHLLCLHEFEVPFYEPFDLKTTVIGNPALSRIDKVDGSAFRTRHTLADGTPIIAVFPGSRVSEIDRIAPHLMQAAAVLSRRVAGATVFAAPAASVSDRFVDLFADDMGTSFELCEEAERSELMAAARVALACSGTVTTEIAVQGTPLVTGYRTGAVTWALAKYLLMRAEFITLLNVSAGRMIVPERLQHEFNARALANDAELLLTDDAVHDAQVAAQSEALRSMGYGDMPAAEIAAEAILKDLSEMAEATPSD